MTDFTPELRETAAALDLPGPVRARILLELSGDLSDMRDALVGLLVFSVAALLWMGLRTRYRRVAGTLGAA